MVQTTTELVPDDPTVMHHFGLSSQNLNFSFKFEWSSERLQSSNFFCSWTFS